MLRVAIAASVLAIVAVPAAAQSAPNQDAQVQAVPGNKDDPNRIVCKKEETIGSRLGAKKICLSAKEWEDRAKADRDQTESIQRLSGTRSGS